MKQKSIKWNAILNVIRMSFSVLFPLITFPYASRVLGAEALGTVNYTLTFVNYAALVAALGISQYSSREGAKIREDRIRIDLFTKQVFTINLLTTLAAYICLTIIVSVLSNIHPYWKLIAIQSLSIIFTTLSVEWINVIYEDYFYITIRGVITNILTMILLFALVKKPTDYYIYASLTVLSHAIISIANYFHCRKYVIIGITTQLNLKYHLKPIFVFFASSLAVSIYVNSDSTMLGWMIGNFNVGLYTAAVKVYSMIKTILAAMYGVTVSRMTFYLSVNDSKSYYTLCRKAINGITTVLMPGAFALFVFSKDIIYILSGSEYAEASSSLQILSIGLGFAIVGGFVTTCVNIPNGREKTNMIAAFASAITNISLNLFIIPLFKQNGAAFTTVLAELLVCLICITKSYDLIKNILNKKMLRALIDGLAGIGIISLSYFVTGNIHDPTTHFILNFTISLVGYGLYLMITGNSIITSYVESVKTRKIKR